MHIGFPLKAQGEHHLLPAKKEEESLSRRVYKLRISPRILSSRFT
jgi:hypothetical protein